VSFSEYNNREQEGCKDTIEWMRWFSDCDLKVENIPSPSTPAFFHQQGIVATNQPAIVILMLDAIGDKNKVVIDIWTRGTINLNFLLQHILNNISQTICEYALETCFLTRTVPLCKKEGIEKDTVATMLWEDCLISNCKQVMEQALRLSTPSVHLLKVSIVYLLYLIYVLSLLFI